MDKSIAIRKIYTNVVTINDETCTDKDGNVVDIDESLVNAKIAENEYKEKRQAEYPDFREYLDGIVKGDQAQIDKYIADCEAVKTKYPKPE